MTKPKISRPFQLNTSESHKLCDYKDCCYDLELSLLYFKRVMTGVEYFPVYPSIDENNFNSWSYLISACVHYRRAFNGGVGSRLSPEFTYGENQDFLRMHSKIIDVTNQHIVHKVNNLDFSQTYIYIDFVDDIATRVGGVAYERRHSCAFTLEEFDLIMKMIQFTGIPAVKNQIQAQEQIVLAQVGGDPLSAIQELPDGFAPHIEGRRLFRQRRRSPTK